MRPHEFDNMIREIIASDELPVAPERSDFALRDDGTYVAVVFGEGKTYWLDGRTWVEAE